MKINITIPETLNEITLYQYQRFEKLISNNEPSDFVNQKTIEIFCNIELKDVARIRIAEVSEILTHINNLLQQKPKLTNTFKLGVYEFGFIPKLEDITAGEYIDLESYLSDTQTLHKAMAVLYRPIKNKTKSLYTIEEYSKDSQDMAEVLKYMPLDVALGSMLFFWTLLNDCVNGLADFIQSEVEQSEQAKNILEKNGVGINHSMQQLREMYSNLMPLQGFPSHN
jgi:hypothetical protein